MEEDVKTLSDYLDILRRRRRSLILPICIVFAIALVASKTLPVSYRSTATILIEEQEIPADFVRTTITGFAEQRLQTLNQRIMSSTRLIEIINRFNLYENLKKNTTTEEIVDIMRKNIKFSTISAEVADPGKGMAPTPVTIAFTLSYDGRNPQIVQQVTNTLSSLFLEENIKVREERALGASTFLNEEAKAVQQQLAEIDTKIAQYKERHVNELPELLQLNLSAVDRAERDKAFLKEQVRTLIEKESYLRAQLLAIPTDAASHDRALLNELKAKLVQMQSRYSDKHPDVRKAKTEIAELEKRLNTSDAKPAGTAGKLKTVFSPLDQPDNPAYVNLASQLMSVQSELETVKRQIEQKDKERDDYQRRIDASPKVEESYKTFISDRNNLQQKFDDLMRKAMEARVAQGLEKEKLGERFTIIDPARLPEKPVKPNVPAILLIGLFLGIGAGVGTAALQEFNDQSVRNPKMLTEMTRLPVLVTVPEIITESDRLRKRRLRIKALWVAVGLCILGIICFHLFVMDLDVLWAKLSRRFL